MTKTTSSTAGLRRYLTALPAKAQNGANAAASIYAENVAIECPIEEGDLKATITSRPLPPDGNTFRAEVVAGEGLPDGRAGFTNYGTVNQPPQLWFEGGIDEAKPDAHAIIARALKG
jgi:hypothetical protein